MTRRVLTVAAAVCCLVAAPAAQIPVGTRVGVEPTGHYDPAGRRDPFVSLIATKRPPRPEPAPLKPASGLAGVSLADATVRGVVRVDGKPPAALIEGPDGRTFVARPQDRLQDAVVKSIDATGVVFVEQVTDVVGAVRSREVRKPLRAGVEDIR